MKSFRALIPFVCLAAGSFLAPHAPIGVANAMPFVAVDVNGQPQAFHAPDFMQVQDPRAAIMHAATQDIRGGAPHELQGLPKHEDDKGSPKPAKNTSCEFRASGGCPPDVENARSFPKHENDNGRKDPPDPPKNPGFHPKCDKYTRGCAAEAQGVDSRAPLALRHDGAAPFEQQPKMIIKKYSTVADDHTETPDARGEGQSPTFEAHVKEEEAGDHVASNGEDPGAATATGHHEPRKGFLAYIFGGLYGVHLDDDQGNASCPANSTNRPCTPNKNAGRPISPEHCDWNTRDCKAKGSGGGGTGAPPASATQALAPGQAPSQNVKAPKHKHGALGHGQAHGHVKPDQLEHHGHVNYTQVDQGHKEGEHGVASQGYHGHGVATDGHPGTPIDTEETGTTTTEGGASDNNQSYLAVESTGHQKGAPEKKLAAFDKGQGQDAPYEPEKISAHVKYAAVVPRWREHCDEHTRNCERDNAKPRFSSELSFKNHETREEEVLGQLQA